MASGTTTVDIDGLSVIFPYPNPYKEQVEYMTQMKLSIDAKGPCVLEMPSGTGKTVCILSLIIAYMSQNDEVGPLIYLTRTIPELEQGISELKHVNKIRKLVSDSQYDKNFLGVALSCRANLCIFPEVYENTSRSDVDAKCKTRVVPWTDVRCEFHDHELVRPRPGVYGLSELKQFGTINGICPFYLSRRLLREAQVIMGSFAYVLDPKASEILMKTLPKTAIVVFDEAHNIDDVCCDSLSQFIDRKMLEKAAQSLDAGQNIANQIKNREQTRLQNAFETLKRGLEFEETDIGGAETMEILSHPLLPQHVLTRAMPKSLVHFNEFIENARKLITFLAAFTEGIEKPEGGKTIDPIIPNANNTNNSNNTNNANNTNNTNNNNNNTNNNNTNTNTNNNNFIFNNLLDNDDNLMMGPQSEKYTTDQVIEAIKAKCGVDAEVLSYMPRRFATFLSKNKVKEIGEFGPLLSTLEFAASLTTCKFGYCVYVEQTMIGPVLEINCLDSSLAFKRVQTNFQRIIITSGTLSPLSIYPRLLKFEPVAMVDFTMSLSRNCLLPLIVTQGYEKTPLSSSFRLRSNPKVAKTYGDLLLEYSKIIPDGIICFFPSYVYMQLVFNSWNESGLIKEVMQYKLVFLEAQGSEETSISFENYRKAIEYGRGAVFIGVARGRVSEGIDFANHYGRCVILMGLPVRNTLSMLVQTRAEFVESEYGMDRHEFILFDAMRAASQCVGRLLRSKNDYGIVVMADRRYAREKLRSQLPHWIKHFINNNRVTVTIDRSIELSKQFLLQMAQPFQHDPNKLIESTNPTKF